MLYIEIENVRAANSTTYAVLKAKEKWCVLKRDFKLYSEEACLTCWFWKPSAAAGQLT